MKFFINIFSFKRDRPDPRLIQSQYQRDECKFEASYHIIKMPSSSGHQMAHLHREIFSLNQTKSVMS